jgi:KUP system potassium uptake protein
MAIDGILAFVVARGRWRWSLPLAAGAFGFFLLVDLAFFSANTLKIPDGGWFPLVLGAIVFALLSTWRRGRRILFERLVANAPELHSFVATLLRRSPQRVSGIAVFLTGAHDVAPRALLHNLKHNKVLHDCVVVVTVETVDEPRVAEDERIEAATLDGNFHQVLIRYGFMEEPDIPRALAGCRLIDRDPRHTETTFFLSRETLIPSIRPELKPWRERIFIALTSIALPATQFFNLPPDRVMEVGTQVEI